jgi:hypothetical protein
MRQLFDGDDGEIHPGEAMGGDANGAAAAMAIGFIFIGGDAVARNALEIYHTRPVAAANVGNAKPAVFIGGNLQPIVHQDNGAGDALFAGLLLAIAIAIDKYPPDDRTATAKAADLGDGSKIVGRQASQTGNYR